MNRPLACLFALLSSMAASAHAQITVTEGSDFSNTLPGTAYVLGVGVNTFSGTVATPTDRQDNFQVTVPAGGSLNLIALSLDTSRGFIGSVTFNLSENRTTSGTFSMGAPFGPGTYQVQVITDFAVGNNWAMLFTVTDPSFDAGTGLDAGTDSGVGTDAGADSGVGMDAGADASVGTDAGADSGAVSDSGVGSDAPMSIDGGRSDGGRSDSGPTTDAPTRDAAGLDGGRATDAGTGASAGGCGCRTSRTSSAGAALLFGLLAVGAAARRTRRR